MTTINIRTILTITLPQLALTLLCLLLLTPLISKAISVQSCTIDQLSDQWSTEPNNQNFQKGDYVVSATNFAEQQNSFSNESGYQLYPASYSQQTCNNILFFNKSLDISLLTIGAIETVCLFSPEPISKPIAVTLHVSGALLGQMKFFVQMAADDCSRNEILSQARKENQQIIENTVLYYLEQQGAQIRSVK